MLTSKFNGLVRLARPKHYIKNGLIFLPLIFSGELFDIEKVVQIIIGVIAFSLMTSVVYIINDVRDVQKDRVHLEKKNRPLASELVTVREALIFASILLIAVIALGIIQQFGVFSWMLLATYLGINIGYSLGLKNIPIVDVAILSAGFLIRVLFGGDLISVGVSKWLYMTVLAGAFYLSLGKRRNEMMLHGAKSRRVNEFYSLEFLNKNMYVCLSLVLVFYSLWATDPTRSDSLLYLTIPIIIIIFMTYSLTVEGKKSSGDPTDVLMGNKPLLILVAVYFVITLGLIYL